MLFQFATQPHFIKDQSDFLFEKGSEIYQIALMVFEEYANVKDILRSSIIEWVSSNKIRLSITDIISFIPTQDHAKMNELPIQKSLEEVFTYCVNSVSDSLHLLGEFCYRLWQTVPRAD